MSLGLDYFARVIADKHDLSKATADNIMRTLRDEMRARATAGEMIQLTEFGTIKRKRQAARTTPQGKKIGEKWRFVFHSSDKLKRMANGGVK